jgi:hypothetical protein
MSRGAMHTAMAVKPRRRSNTSRYLRVPGAIPKSCRYRNTLPHQVSRAEMIDERSYCVVERGGSRRHRVVGLGPPTHRRTRT